MDELVFMNNDQIVTSSRNIARDFGKEHRNVMRDIEGVLKNEQAHGMFYKTTYIHEQNKQEYPMYLMNRDGFTLLVMGFTGNKAMEFKLKYIDAFNKMEQFMNSPEMIVQRALEIQQRKVELLEQQIEEDKRYTNFGKVVEVAETSINVGAYAKLLYEKHGINIGRNKLMAWLREKGFLIKQMGRERNFPKQKYIEQGLFELKPAIVKRTQGDVQSGTPMITGKGQIKLSEMLIEEFKRGEAS